MSEENTATAQDDAFLEVLREDIANNRLELPSLPDLALKVRQSVSDPDMDMGKLAKLISADAQLAGRLLQIANSPYFRGLQQVNDLRSAIMRLGATCVRNLVTSLTTGQMYKNKELRPVEPMLRESWRHSVAVAAFSFAIAGKHTRRSPDEALLAGLLHNVGYLPMLSRAVKNPEFMKDDVVFREALWKMHGEVGAVVLEAWGLPQNIVAVPTHYLNFEREHVGDPDFIDVVQVANLHVRLGSGHPVASIPWSEVKAFDRLGLTPESSIQAMREAKAEIKQVENLLSGG